MPGPARTPAGTAFQPFGPGGAAETDIPLQKGQVCNDRQKRAVFPFVHNRIYDINELRDGNNVVLSLRSSGPYHNEERRGILYYQGQNTGEGPPADHLWQQDPVHLLRKPETAHLSLPGQCLRRRIRLCRPALSKGRPLVLPAAAQRLRSAPTRSRPVFSHATTKGTEGHPAPLSPDDVLPFLYPMKKPAAK